jgi:glutamate--cysteine ligase
VMSSAPMRRKLDGKGQDEGRHIECLHEIARSGRTTADEMLASFDGDWQGKTNPVFKDYAY